MSVSGGSGTPEATGKPVRATPAGPSMVRGMRVIGSGKSSAPVLVYCCRAFAHTVYPAVAVCAWYVSCSSSAQVTASWYPEAVSSGGRNTWWLFT